MTNTPTQAAVEIERLRAVNAELVEALEILMKRVDHWFDGDERPIVLARAAINRATNP